MKKLLLLTLMLSPLASFSQVDLNLISASHRMGVNSWFDNGLEYSEFPEFFDEPTHFFAKVENLDADSATNVVLEVDIYHDNVFQLNMSSQPKGLCGGCTDTIWISSYQPSWWNTEYEFRFEISSDSIDSDLSNNMDTTHVVNNSGSAHSYKRDRDVILGSVDSIPGSGGWPTCFGNEFEIFHDAEIESIETTLSDSSTSAGHLIFGMIEIWDTTAGQWYWLAQTTDYSVQNGDLGENIQLILDSKPSICAGEKILVSACHYGGLPAVYFEFAQESEDSTVWGNDFQGIHVPLQNVIRCNPVVQYDDNCMASINENLSVQLNIHPNPTTDFLFVDVPDLTYGTVTIKDVNGKVVDEFMTTDPNMILDLSEYSNGMYFLHLQTENEQTVERFIVSK